MTTDTWVGAWCQMASASASTAAAGVGCVSMPIARLSPSVSVDAVLSSDVQLNHTSAEPIAPALSAIAWARRVVFPNPAGATTVTIRRENRSRSNATRRSRTTRVRRGVGGTKRKPPSIGCMTAQGRAGRRAGDRD